MTSLDLVIEIFSNTLESIPNDKKYAIRREVAVMMENSEFGMVTESHDHFANTFAVPLRDEYTPVPSATLLFLYNFVYPVDHGNLPFLFFQGIPKLIDTIHHDYGLEICVRMYYNT